MATAVRMKRKREPLIRAACPKCGHKRGGVLIVYSTHDGCRYMRCHRWPLCKGTGKRERS